MNGQSNRPVEVGVRYRPITISIRIDQYTWLIKQARERQEYVSEVIRAAIDHRMEEDGSLPHG